MERPDFIMFFRAVLDHKGCSKIDAELYGYIYWLTQLKHERCIASNQTLASLVSTSEGVIENSLTSLERAGFIKRTFKDDNARKGRLEIIPLLVFTKLPSPDGRGPIPRWDKLPSAGGYKKSINKSSDSFPSEKVSSSEKNQSQSSEKWDVDGDGNPVPPKPAKVVEKIERDEGLRVLNTVHALFKKETGVDPILGPVALKAIRRALQHLSSKDIVSMIEDSIADGSAEKAGLDLFRILSDAKINKFKIENQ